MVWVIMGVTWVGFHGGGCCSSIISRSQSASQFFPRLDAPSKPGIARGFRRHNPPQIFYAPLVSRSLLPWTIVPSPNFSPIFSTAFVANNVATTVAIVNGSMSYTGRKSIPSFYRN
jgi:hypothetical protein